MSEGRREGGREGGTAPRRGGGLAGRESMGRQGDEVSEG